MARKGCARGRGDSTDLELDANKRNIYVAKSFRLSVIDWLHVARLYVPYTLTAALVFAVSCLLPQGLVAQYASDPRAAQAYALSLARQTGAHVASVWYAYAIIAACVVWLITSKPPVYLVDFCVFEPPPDWQVSRAEIVQLLRRMGCYQDASIDFMQRLLAKSGTGEGTHWPPGTVKLIRPGVTPAHFEPLQEWRGAGAVAASAASSSSAAAASSSMPHGGAAPQAPAVVGPSGTATQSSSSSVPTGGAAPPCAGPARGNDHDVVQADGPDVSIHAARLVAEQVLCSTFEDLLLKTGVKPRDIDFLIVNCSLFAPTPSLASMVARRFGLRPSARTYSLGGMGCSASIVSVDLAKQLLQNRRNSLAVVLSTEEITQQLYRGNRKDLLLQNTLFRVGGAAVLLSNKLADGFRAKYKLLHTVRVQDMSDEGNGAVFQCQDETGLRGISLSKELLTVAGRALKDNLTVLGPQILPIREQLKVVWSLACRAAVPRLNAVGAWLGLKASLEKKPVYVPDFRQAVAHFCIHAGGRAVIDGIEANLKLDRVLTAPSRATLFHWGNTSSSSIWYELRYVEGENDRVQLPGLTAAPSPAEDAADAAADGADGVPPGWDPAHKWALPEYRGRHVRSGERVLQIAFGSGFKCNSAVWLRMR